jgi:GntR family transcriptional regulator / MocR family aminotransferase
VLDGRFGPGMRLPATRDLARQYGLARGTIVAAFEHLRAEGYLEGRVGSGTFVRRVLPDDLLEVRGRQRPAPAAVPSAVRLSAAAERARLFGGVDDAPPRAFRTNLPAVDLFPTALWAQLVARRCRRASLSVLRGCHVLGHPALRDAVAEHLRVSRGVRAAGHQVAIVSGAQEALDLVARLLLDPGDRAGVEDPGYPGASGIFAAAGATVVSVAIDEHGAVVPRAADSRLRLVYLTPAHQCPLGVTMSLERRLAFLEWARRTSTMLVEDDYDSEYRYRGRPVPALHGLDRHGRVIYVGTFNKVLFPSLRLGFVVVPEALVERLAALKSIATRHAPVLEQLVLLDFVADGHFGRHLRRMREAYAARLQALREGAARDLRPWITLSDIDAGLQTVAWLGGGVSDEAVARAARAVDVDVTPLSRYARERTCPPGLLLGFGGVDETALAWGTRTLARALRAMRRRS